MIGQSVIYNGREVPVAGFRTFVYDKENNKKIVNSWGEYTKAISTGIWFAISQEKEGLQAPVIIEPNIEDNAPCVAVKHENKKRKRK